MPTTKKTTPKRAGKTQRLDETPSSPVLVVDNAQDMEGHNTVAIGNEYVTAEIVDKKTELARNKGGRPTIFNKEMAFSICEQVVEGRSLRSILRDDDMPSMATIFRWLDGNKWFREQYAWAKDNQADTNAEDIQDIANRTLKGEYEPQAARVAIDAYKWTASKLKPKKYGDKLDLTSDGKQMPAPIISIAAVPQNKEINS